MWNKGYALPIVLIILALMFGIAAILLAQIDFNLQANELYRDYQCCILSEQSSFEEIEAQLNQDLSYAGSGGKIIDGNGVECNIKIQNASSTVKEITVECSKGKYKKIFTGQAMIEGGKVVAIRYQLVK